MEVLPVRFQFSASIAVGGILIFGGVVAFISAWIIPIPFLLRPPLAVIFVWLFFRAFCRHALLLGPLAVHELHLADNKNIILSGKDGKNIANGKLVGCSISPLLTVAVVGGERKMPVLIMPDSLPADDYRRLRVRLNVLSSMGEKSDPDF